MTDTIDADVKPKARSPQPKCAKCNHVLSFHNGAAAQGKCFVVGCTCVDFHHPAH